MSQTFLHLAVGRFCPNRRDDVETVQKLLNRYAYATHKTLFVDGVFGRKTEEAIREFQRTVLVMRFPDGVVDVNGITLERLARTSPVPKPPNPLPPHPHAPYAPPSPKPGATPNHVLSESDFEAAAKALGCDVAAIKAVAKTETGPCGTFDAQNRPVILYERHYFSQLTMGRYDKTHEDISSPVPYSKTKKGYGKCREQYPKLDRATLLDHDAALKSASWGAFQLMGKYYGAAGYSSIDAFVAGMQSSVQGQLTAFVNFIIADPRAHTAIQEKRWASFAAAYNGPGWEANHYDTKMAQAYREAGEK